MSSNNDSDRLAMPRVVPNLMPCKIVPAETTVTKQLWNPVIDEEMQQDGSRQATAYFRGRRLVGKEIDLPKGSIGLIPDPKTYEESLQQNKKRPTSKEDSEDEDEENASVPLPRMEPKYHFTKMRVFGHEESPASDIAQMKALQEWSKMAAAIHDD